MRPEYRYLSVRPDDVDTTLESYAVKGWQVAFFNRNQNASVIDILLVRAVRGGDE